MDYVQGKERPNVECILCSIRDEDEKVINLKLYQDATAFVVLNLYPYNPAHIMVVPLRHVLKYTDLTKQELLHLSRMIQGLELMIDDLYNPKGYNIGMNQGRIGGASIEHLHFHIVPRYGNELGFIDIVGKTRVVVEGLEGVKKKISEHVHEYLNEEFFKNF